MNNVTFYAYSQQSPARFFMIAMIIGLYQSVKIAWMNVAGLLEEQIIFVK